jgi:hypothetical protein
VTRRGTPASRVPGTQRPGTNQDFARAEGGWNVLVQGELRRAHADDIDRRDSLVSPRTVAFQQVIGRVEIERSTGWRLAPGLTTTGARRPAGVADVDGVFLGAAQRR